jgi:hypothetical protein
MSVIEVIVVLVAVIVAVAVVAGAWVVWRHLSLWRRFRLEYRRLAKEKGFLAAEWELRERQRRHSKLELRAMDEATLAKDRAAWTEVQIQFVDNPRQAVRAADALVDKLVAERGYPIGNYDEKVALLSVDYSGPLDRYRRAREVHTTRESAEVTIDQMRAALVDYRALVAALLRSDPVERPGRERERSKQPKQLKKRRKVEVSRVA